MDNARPVADRVRHILQAMERSIDAARQRRLYAGEPQHNEEEDQVGPPPSEPREMLGTESSDPPRLKARPKRPSPFGELKGDQTIHSRAG